MKSALELPAPCMMKDDEVGEALWACHLHDLPVSTGGSMHASACMYTAHAPSEAAHARGVEDNEVHHTSLLLLCVHDALRLQL